MPHSGGRPSARAPSVARAHAPASCQTKTQQQFVTHRAATRALPPSLGLRSVLFTVPFVFVRWRFSEERKQAGNGRKGKNNEIRRDQEQNQRGIQLSGGSTGLRTERHFDTVSQRDGPIPQLLLWKHHAHRPAESHDMLLYLAGVNEHAALRIVGSKRWRVLHLLRTIQFFSTMGFTSQRLKATFAISWNDDGP